MTPERIALVRESFAKVRPIADDAAALFYGRLFQIAPEVRPLFPADLTEQGRKLMTTLAVVVNSLDDLPALLPVVQRLGARHAGYGVTGEHFAPVGAALLWTLEKGLGEGFTPEVRMAWTEAYHVLATVMIDALKSAAPPVQESPFGRIVGVQP
ncbi:globin [Ancylobacter novellus DSM 506]|uniref:Globin n=1 Tax=Ancylobacter novellus (strain ATCC 8093 / DSM 506 / JCM 20403 / CCM 1077 / IAM 12100 / NBRC 12443 / NCIMB 10456) TaxID=639283 RepID=D7A317_ANCN5|nr:globin family protein [Ancylobacter novellus]ADH87735.1 globin [Ancylobacter novellus DSM 506]